MIAKVEAKNRYLANHGWLSSYHLFSFADYYDPGNMNFGALRVFNDDRIDGENGFPKHGHQNMEIVTIMLEGELTHEDTMGNKKSMKKGEVQYMSAGTGVMHSEMNLAKERIHLYQIWIMPRKNGLVPAYNQKNFSGSRKNELVPVVSDHPVGDAIIIQADAIIYKGDFDKGKSCTHNIQQGRGIFIYVTDGTLLVNETLFEKGDQARIEDEETITLSSQKETTFILIDTIL